MILLLSNGAGEDSIGASPTIVNARLAELREARLGELDSDSGYRLTALGEELLRDTVETFPDIQDKEGTFPAPHEDYSWKLSVKETLFPDAREVHVTVTWTVNGQEESLSLAGGALR